MLKIAIASLTNRGFKAETVKSLLELKCPYKKSIIIATQGYHIAENRNYMAVQAIKNKCDFIFSFDDDMVFPPNTLEKLLSYRKDIIGVNSHPTAGESKTYEPIGEEKDGLIECNKVGTGIILIKTEIFNKIPRPWFSFKNSELGNTINGEDWMFCLRAREVGFKIWVDVSLEIGHIGQTIF